MAGARAVVDYLLSVHGHRSVALITSEASVHEPEAREAGWRDALRSHGRSDGLLVRTAFTRAGGYEAAQRVLAGADRPTAIFISSDLQAFGVLRAIRERGLAVPGDIALVTFDGIEESALSWPPLTLTQQPLQAMAEAAISALLGANDAAHDLFPMELIIRESCGCGDNGRSWRIRRDTSGQDIGDRFDHDCLRRAVPIACGGCPRPRVCEIITVPHRADRHIQRGGQI